MHLVRFEKGVSVAKVTELTKPGGAGFVTKKRVQMNALTCLLSPIRVVDEVVALGDSAGSGASEICAIR